MPPMDCPWKVPSLLTLAPVPVCIICTYVKASFGSTRPAEDQPGQPYCYPWMSHSQERIMCPIPRKALPVSHSQERNCVPFLGKQYLFPIPRRTLPMSHSQDNITLVPFSGEHYPCPILRRTLPMSHHFANSNP